MMLLVRAPMQVSGDPFMGLGVVWPFYFMGDLLSLRESADLLLRLRENMRLLQIYIGRVFL